MASVASGSIFSKSASSNRSASPCQPSRQTVRGLRSPPRTSTLLPTSMDARSSQRTSSIAWRCALNPCHVTAAPKCRSRAQAEALDPATCAVRGVLRSQGQYGWWATRYGHYPCLHDSGPARLPCWPAACAPFSECQWMATTWPPLAHSVGARPVAGAMLQFDTYSAPFQAANPEG